MSLVGWGAYEGPEQLRGLAGEGGAAELGEHLAGREVLCLHSLIRSTATSRGASNQPRAEPPGWQPKLAAQSPLNFVTVLRPPHFPGPQQ